MRVMFGRYRIHAHPCNAIHAAPNATHASHTWLACSSTKICLTSVSSRRRGGERTRIYEPGLYKFVSFSCEFCISVTRRRRRRRRRRRLCHSRLQVRPATCWHAVWAMLFNFMADFVSVCALSCVFVSVFPAMEWLVHFA